MTDSNPLTVAKRWHADIYLRGDMQAAEEICADDMIAHGTGVAPDAPRGPKFVQEDAEGLRAAFTIDALTDDDVIVAGDKVVIRWTFRGAHTGSFMGVDPTGRRVTLEGIDIFHVENGKITEFWNGYDLLTLAEQVGAVSPAI
jgi:predicted ester cyclase